MAELDPRTAYETAQASLRYVESFNGQDWDSSTFGNPDRMNLALALDRLEEVSAMLLNQSDRLRAAIADPSESDVEQYRMSERAAVAESNRLLNENNAMRAALATAQQAEPPQELSDEQIWNNDTIMAANAVAGLPMQVLGLLARAVIAADRAQAPQALAVSVEPQAMGAEGQWQPIETAPKDGTHILTWWAGCVRTAWCARPGESRDGGDWWRGHSLMVTSPGEGRPTHWMPLPAAPNRSQDTAA